jgi:NAD(P)-dependent dehydrogenase (short-subunit alcohol dehydrogenase family)
MPVRAQPLVHPDERVTPLTLDVTDPAQVQRAAEKVGSLDLLFNNAGVAPSALTTMRREGDDSAND